MELSAEQLATLAKMIGGNGAKRKAKGKKADGRVKLTDEQKVVNAAANADAAVKLFTDAGFKNCVAHETIKTYDKWTEVGRKVMKGQKSLRTPKGVALFHLDQTEAIAAKTN